MKPRQLMVVLHFHPYRHVSGGWDPVDGSSSDRVSLVCLFSWWEREAANPYQETARVRAHTNKQNKHTNERTNKHNMTIRPTTIPGTDPPSHTHRYGDLGNEQREVAVSSSYPLHWEGRVPVSLELGLQTLDAIFQGTSEHSKRPSEDINDRWWTATSSTN